MPFQFRQIVMSNETAEAFGCDVVALDGSPRDALIVGHLKPGTCKDNARQLHCSVDALRPSVRRVKAALPETLVGVAC